MRFHKKVAENEWWACEVCGKYHELWLDYPAIYWISALLIGLVIAALA